MRDDGSFALDTHGIRLPDEVQCGPIRHTTGGTTSRSIAGRAAGRGGPVGGKSNEKLFRSGQDGTTIAKLAVAYIQRRSF